MRIGLRRRAVAITAALLSAAALAACTTSEAATRPEATPPEATTPAGEPAGGGAVPPVAAPPPDEGRVAELASLRTAGLRHSAGVIAAGGGDAPYNYGPSVLVEGGTFRMWWCSQLGVAQPPGDDILLAESASLDGGFAGPDGSAGTPVFSGSTTGFDGKHVCDPSVLRVGGTYLMYYTGAPSADHAHSNTIGLATSADGRVWSRANGGEPIVRPAKDVDNANGYGAGQPAAVYLDGWFYLMFTDTTGADVGPNGAGQFVLRSTDPAFGKRVEALTQTGFQELSGAGQRQRSVVDAFSADLMWVDALAAFAIAHETAEGTTITFWDRDFRVNPYQPVVVAGPWREGPGLVRRADGHAVVPVDDPCDVVPIDLVRATREGPHGPTDLRHFGLDIVEPGACASPGRALLTLNGYAMPSPQRTIDLIVGGRIVRVDRRSVAEALAVRILDRRVPVLDQTMIAGQVTAGLPAVRARGRGVGLLIDNRLWPIETPTALDRNSSTIIDVSADQWDTYDHGGHLLTPPR